MKHFIHRKNDFVERSKILAGYRSENNFIEPSKQLIILIVQRNYFSDLCPAKILDFSAKPFFLCISIL